MLIDKDSFHFQDIAAILKPMDFKSHPHWPALSRIYHTLNQNGYKAYLAGGCVRDALLGRAANDLDLATDATPDTIEKLFPKTVAVGKAFGVMLVIEDGISFEVATFRSDGSYKDGRHPESIVFTTPEEDALRRDFTVNALFYDLNQGRVLDFVGGVKDLEDKILKAVGVATERFQEDHLRIFRAIRFSAQLGFEIEKDTLAAVKNLAHLIKSVSPERIHEETLKLLKTEGVVRGLELMAETSVGKNLFPGYNSVLQKSQAQVQKLFPSPQKQEDILWSSFLGLWALQKDLEWDWILNTYRFSRSLSKHLRRCMEHLENPPHFFLATYAEQLSLLGDEGVRMFLRICEKLSLNEAQAKKLLAQWKAWGEKMPAPLVTGDDLKSKFDGRELGNWLHKLYTWQLEGRYQTREELLKQVFN